MGLFGLGKKKSCPVCGKEEEKGQGLEKGEKWYCSEEHAQQAENAHKCATCGTPYKEGTGVWYCSEEHAQQAQKKAAPEPPVQEHPMGAQPPQQAQPQEAQQQQAQQPPQNPQQGQQDRVEY